MCNQLEETFEAVKKMDVDTFYLWLKLQIEPHVDEAYEAGKSDGYADGYDVGSEDGYEEACKDHGYD